jgi:hypothetical protein
MAIQDKITQLWVKTTGRKIDPKEYSWLMGPVGDTKIIQDRFIYELAERQQLEVHLNQPDFGLLERMDDLGFSKEEKSILNPQVADYYENTSNYNFEVWSEWKGIFRPFGKLLHIVFSKRLQQLNLPLSSMDTSKGLKSEIIKLKTDTGITKWTIWYRIIKSSNNVIYSGVYTTCQNPNYENPLLKVVFPLPNRNASVIMTKKVEKDGSLVLCSDGKKFGQNGFYFTLTNHKGDHWARFVGSMHEWIRVYEDDEKILRADHNLNFYGMRFLDLHYKMIKKQ